MYPPYQVLFGLLLALAVHEPIHFVFAKMLGLNPMLKMYRKGILVAILCIVDYKKRFRFVLVALSPLVVAFALAAFSFWWALPVYLSTMVQDFRAVIAVARRQRQ